MHRWKKENWSFLANVKTKGMGLLDQRDGEYK
jgi:hypothetical protein